MRLRGGVYPQDQSIRQYPFGVGGGGLTADQALPWLIDCDVFEQAVNHVNWDNVGTSGGFILNAYKYSSGTQNDSIDFKVVLAAGTWTVEFMSIKNNNRGIMSVQIDGVEKGTVDLYAVTTVQNYLGSVTGIVVATTALVTLRFKVTDKNASSSGYNGALQHIQLRRTA